MLGVTYLSLICLMMKGRCVSRSPLMTRPEPGRLLPLIPQMPACEMMQGMKRSSERR